MRPGSGKSRAAKSKRQIARSFGAKHFRLVSHVEVLLAFDLSQLQIFLHMNQQFGKDVVMDGVRGRGESIFLAIFAGTIAAAVGAAIWMGVTIATNAHIGFVALGVGALVGFAVRFAGNGTGMTFGIIGAVLTLIGCLGGEILTVAQLASTPERDFYTTLTTLDLSQTINNIFNHMDPIMYIIYGVGIYEGYKFSMRK
jgi:hypothetical protein